MTFCCKRLGCRKKVKLCVDRIKKHSQHFWRQIVKAESINDKILSKTLPVKIILCNFAHINYNKQLMWDISFRSICLFLWHNHRNKGIILLTKVITPPYHYIILTYFRHLFAFPAKASLFVSVWSHRQPCTSAVCACHTKKQMQNHKLFQL